MAIKAEFLQAALKARATKKPAAPHRVLSETHHGLTFSAAFDGGNLARVEAVSEDEFTLHARSDCEGTPFATRSRTWFSFSVRGAAPGRTLNFEVRMSNQAKLFGHDHRPCYRALPSQPTWTRLPQPTPCVVDGATTDSFAIQITHTVDTPADDTLFFAFCFPHGYADLMASLAWADALFRQPTASLAPAGRDGEAGWARAVHLLQTTAEQAEAESSTPAAAASASAAGGDGGSGGTPAPVSADQMRVYRAKRLAQAARSAALQASVGMSEREQPADAAAAASTSHHHIAVADAAAAQAALLLPSEKSDPGGGGNGGPASIYYRRELLTRSIEGRRIDLLTITSSNGQLSASEAALLPPLLPDIRTGALGGALGSGAGRPCRFKRKRYVLISGRVHPGETPASHVVDGLIAFLLRPDDPRAVALRELYVFKIIPMLNPDGVFHGHYRSDTRGVDLNRKYNAGGGGGEGAGGGGGGGAGGGGGGGGGGGDAMGDDPHALYPSVTACLEVAKQLHATGELLAYIDTHAHAGRRGCFFYGNQMADPIGRDDSALFARLVALNTRWFDFDGKHFDLLLPIPSCPRVSALRPPSPPPSHDEFPLRAVLSGCTWFEPEAHTGSARAAIFAATGLPHVFTLECNYDSGVSANVLPSRYSGGASARGSGSSRAAGASSAPPPVVPQGRMSPEPSTERALSPKYTDESWRDLGKALALAVLDMANANPCSRLGQAGGDGLAKLRGQVVAAQQQKAARRAERKKTRAAKGGLRLGTRERWGDDDDDEDNDEDDEDGDDDERTAVPAVGAKAPGVAPPQIAGAGAPPPPPPPPPPVYGRRTTSKTTSTPVS